MSIFFEVFYVLRCKCVLTYVLIFICQYVFGIGDRYLFNFMINFKNGEMVGIDFGYVFGLVIQVSIGLVFQLVNFFYSIFLVRYIVYYLGGMNKLNEDIWIYILNLDEFGIKFNNVNLIFYLQFFLIFELILFRLIRQFRNLMMSLQVYGLMEFIMIYIFRVLRNNCDLLLNIMDIFVKELFVDWLVSIYF